MKLKNAYFYTLREDAKDEDSVSGNLLVKAGYIKKTSAGIYIMLPLALKVQEKIQNIIRKHMDSYDCQEIKMPALIAQEYYEKSGRIANFGPSLFRLKDRTNKAMVLGPTHEELFVYAAKSMIRSYKNMPFNLYQFQTKYRDEPRARFGLIRVKEFVMKDAYSFDVDEANLDISYQKMMDVYKKSFDEMGINYRIVKADTGVMGGLLSEEFQAITPVGEDTVCYCDDCGFTSNLEICKCTNPDVPTPLIYKEKSLVETPNAKTIEEVCAFLGKEEKDFVKTLIFMADGTPYAVMVRGDREVSDVKLQKLLRVNEIEMADAATVQEVTGAEVGFAGPVGIKCQLIMDEEVSKMSYYITGANQSGYHYLDVSQADFKADIIADVREAMPGDICPVCGKPLQFTKGIEIGNIFKLGTKYSEALELTFLNKENKTEPVWMGSYGIGIGRCMAAVVEQNHDDKGIIWPINIAPYPVEIIIAITKDATQVQVANDLYNKLQSMGIECLLDDRDERPGVKFNDADLIGIPLRVTVGKKALDGIVELKDRRTGENEDLTIEDLIAKLQSITKVNQ